MNLLLRRAALVLFVTTFIVIVITAVLATVGIGPSTANGFGKVTQNAGAEIQRGAK